jgi:hypothetical protein
LQLGAVVVEPLQMVVQVEQVELLGVGLFRNLLASLVQVEQLTLMAVTHDTET